MSGKKRFWFTFAASTVAGVVGGFFAATGNWSSELIFAVALTSSFTISTIALRDVLFAPGPRQRRPRSSAR